MSEQDAGVLSRSKERRVFLFEQIVIFSELLRKGSSTPGYQFKKSIKVRRGEGDEGWGVSGAVLRVGIKSLWLRPLRCPTWVWRTAWTTIPASSCCRVGARRSVSPCRPPTSTSSRCGSDTSRSCWTLKATSCQVREITRIHFWSTGKV